MIVRKDCMAEYKLEHPDTPDKKREELKSRVLQLKDLVNYNEGTVASRKIISRKVGNITIFSFDENEGLSPSRIVTTASNGAVCSESPSFSSNEKIVIFPALREIIIRLATVPSL